MDLMTLLLIHITWKMPFKRLFFSYAAAYERANGNQASIMVNVNVLKGINAYIIVYGTENKRTNFVFAIRKNIQHYTWVSRSLVIIVLLTTFILKWNILIANLR